MSKENQNKLSEVQELRESVLQSGFKRAENVEITQEDVNIIERNIATRVKENEKNRNRAIETAEELFVV